MSDPLLPPRVRRLFRTAADTDARVGRDVDDELAFHVEMRARELEANGLGHEAALAEANRQFGDRSDVKRHALVVSALPRRRWLIGEVLRGWSHDLRAAIRQFARAPIFSAIAVLTLALGIGANAAMFSVIHRLLLDPLPYRDGNRMVEVWLGSGMLSLMPDGAAVDAWRARARTFDDFTVTYGNEYAVDDGTHEAREPGVAIAPNFFSFLGVQPAAGRAFTDEDTHERRGSAPVAIIGYGLWQQRYGGSADALGKTIRVDSVARTIVGVAPPELGVPFGTGAPPVVWIPVDRAAHDADVSGDNQYETIGKLRRGVTVAAATAELSAITTTVDHENSHGPRPTAGVKVMRPQDLLGDHYERALVLLFAAVSAVLLIACANVAHLLLARAWGRQREFAVRGALGAGRSRLARQMFCESVVLAIAGGALGLLIAWVALHAIIALRPAGFDSLAAVHLEPAVLAWTTGISLLSAVLFGFGPAVFAGRQRGAELLKAGTRVANASTRARRVRGGLIVVEVGLSVTLLVVAGLLVRTYDALQRVPLGFDPVNLSAVRISLPRTVPMAARPALWADILARVRAVPGVAGADIGGLPLDPGIMMGDIEPEGGRPAGVAPIRLASMYLTQPSYFNVARIGLRGRTFRGDTTADAPGPENEVIVNETMARRLWPNGRALGARMRSNPRSGWLTVVGIARDVNLPGRSGGRYDFQIYYPLRIPFPSMMVSIRGNSPIEALLPSLRRAIAAASPALAIGDVQTSEVQLRDLLAGKRFAMTLLSMFAAVALALSAIGLYGVISYAVGQRTHEIGVRMSLGAQPRDVVRLVIRESGLLVALGLGVGLLGAGAVSRAVRSYLFGVTPGDAVTYLVVSGVIAVVGLAACYEPVRRALRVDPIVALASD